MADDPHAHTPTLHAGTALAEARLALIALHGRGADAADILGLATSVDAPGVAFVAPEAAGHAWYPNRFLAPLASNEPWLTSALRRVDALLDEIGRSGIAPERTVLLGFSQGACLALEFAARNPKRYHAVVALSGGLIGPPGTRWDAGDSLAGTPVFLGCSDVDFHIPKERVVESADAFRARGAAVTLRLYRGMGHTVVPDEIAWVEDLLAIGGEPAPRT